ncbi:MAG: pyridoxal phosphate-dependent aminotransferase [Alphaproteobacteria bacterium]|jgi:aspartate/methionine/tyrosine aminotransferase|nr:pyridoxal phosphate-dependent aminotransferase [Alphaproteobacteria bacterium]
MTKAAAGKPMLAALPGLRPGIEALETQQIMQVSTLALEDPNVIPLWYGESDVPTPAFICQAAADALAAGHTFYTHKWGIPELRETLVRYGEGLYGIDLDVDRITVTSSGMTGIMMLMQALVDPGDNVIVVDPIWPNAAAAAEVMGGEVRRVGLEADAAGAWRLDLERVLDSADERTRLVFVNSPGNPTGWMMSRAEQQALLDFCRERGMWVVADEVYARIVYEGAHAPSFLEIADPEDPVIVVNSFSKSWAMTGWRMGWLTHPAAIRDDLGNLVEYNTSGTPAFLQHAGVTAVSQGEDFVASMVARCRTGREVVSRRLAELPRVTYSPPEAAFYAFFALEGMDNSLSFAQRLVHEAGVGLAPGTAFGPHGEGWLRLCFARAPGSLEEAMDRLAKALA